MKMRNELVIWSMVTLGLLLYVGTFIVAWNSTEDYRENVSRPLNSQVATIQKSLQAQ
jgi:hypothetical protein